MATTGSNSGLQRKMQASREGAASSGRSAAGALRLAMARAADDLFDLAVSVIGVTQCRVGQDELGKHLSEERLQILLDGPEGARGAVTLERVLLTALIQKQTIGSLTGAAPDERPFTGTDAALCAPLIDSMLERASGLADQPQDIRCLSGFRFGARAEDPRAVILTMEAERFRIFDLTLELDGGPQQGAMCLILPEPETPAESADGDAAAQNLPRLGAAVEMARADLSAVICRMRIPLTELSAMQVGDLLALVPVHMSRTELVTIQGKTIAAGRLGQTNGMRALRLNEARPHRQETEADGFAETIGVQAAQRDISNPAASDSSILEIEHSADLAQVTGLEYDDDEAVAQMTPAEVAKSISTLAGISEEDLGEIPLPATTE